MKTKMIAAAVLATLSMKAMSQQDPKIPYIDANNQRIPVEQADKYAEKSNQEVFKRIDELRAQQRQYQANMAQRQQALLAERVNSPGSRFIQEAKDNYSPNPKIKINPKESKVIPVGQGLLNTISTNFTELKVKTSDRSSIIETDGGDLHIAIATSNPVGLVLYEAGAKETQISLTLMPIDAPPIIADVEVQLNDEMIAKSIAYQKRMKEAEAMRKSKSERVSYSNKHNKRIVELLTPVAQGDIPRGFTLSNEVPNDYQKPCRIAIPHQAVQRIKGGAEIIDVVAVRNDSDRVYQVREEMCLADDVIAVALFKKSYLAPNEEMELYILRDTLHKRTIERKSRRPRATLGE